MKKTLNLLMILALSFAVLSCGSSNKKDEKNKTKEEKEVVKSAFDQAIEGSIPVVVDFYADWCKPCQIQGPIIDDLAKELGEQIKVIKVNVDNEQALAARFEVQSIPTIMIFKENRIVFKAVGVQNTTVLKNALGDLGIDISVGHIEKSQPTSSFDQAIAGSTPVLVDFYATWCKPCQIQAPIIDELERELGGQIKVIKVDIDREMELSQRYGIQSIPTIMIFKENQIVFKALGVQNKETLMQAINNL
ncbi:MAG TPA: thioredoxin [Bacteroidales bacterium]|nr:thioredoxin [Bacteroidales bacterium]HOR59737.1 thioredoxin [Bacteroidales bacterium]HPL04706.1 thioredoxin [Bacteroidales bacterium]